MYQFITPSLSQTLWPRWASKQFLSLPIVQILLPCDFWLFPKLRGCHYVTTEEMKEAMTKVIDTFTQEDFYRAFQKLLEGYNKCIAARGDYFEGDKSFTCVLSIKVSIRKKSGNSFNEPHIRPILPPVSCLTFHFLVVSSGYSVCKIFLVWMLLPFPLYIT